MDKRMKAIIRSYQSGNSLREVADKFSTSHETIRKALLENGVILRGHSSPREKDLSNVTTMVKLYKKGLSLRQVSEHVNSAPSTIRKRLIEVGVQLRQSNGG